MFGFPTRDGEFGWQASLELLHPSLGFIGHWCGGVLIHKYWVLSSAHCIHKWVIMKNHSTMFNCINQCLFSVTCSICHYRHCGQSFWEKIIASWNQATSNEYRLIKSSCMKNTDTSRTIWVCVHFVSCSRKEQKWKHEKLKRAFGLICQAAKIHGGFGDYNKFSAIDVVDLYQFWVQWIYTDTVSTVVKFERDKFQTKLC